MIKDRSSEIYLRTRFPLGFGAVLLNATNIRNGGNLSKIILAVFFVLNFCTALGEIRFASMQNFKLNSILDKSFR